MSSRKGRRDAARMVRAELARERRRRRTLWTSVAAVAVLVIAGLVGWGVWASQRPTEVTVPTGANEEGTGIVAGSGPVTIDIYEDFLCPACKQFEQSAGPTLDQLISEGKVRVVYHPVAYLNRYSTTQYSTRSSAASACAAENRRFREYAKRLFEAQPAEGGPGLSEDQLTDLAVEAGLDRDGFAACQRDGVFKPWTDQITDEASRSGITGTPTILVAGEQLADRSPEGIRAAVAEAGP